MTRRVARRRRRRRNGPRARRARAARARGERGAGSGSEARSRAKGRAGSRGCGGVGSRPARRETRREEPKGSSGVGGFPVATPRLVPGARAAGGAHRRGSRGRVTDPRDRTVRVPRRAALRSRRVSPAAAARFSYGSRLSRGPLRRAGRARGQTRRRQERAVGRALDVPRILVDAVARDAGTTPASALGSLSHWKLLTCSGGNGEGTESEAWSTRAWVRAKLSRGVSRARRPETSGETSSALLSLYASRPFAVAEAVGGDASPGKPNEATLWVCARDARDVPPPRYASASAALFVLRLAPARSSRGGSDASAGAIPSAEEARLRAFASSLVRVGGDQARAFANPRLVPPPRALPLLVLVEGEAFEGSAAERRATEAAIASAVAGAVASAASGNVENATPSVPVRVDSIGGSITADAGSEASRTQARKLWARRNDALAEGLRWMASVAPPEPYFRAAYLRDEVRDALARRGGTRDAPAATPGHASASGTTLPSPCARAWRARTRARPPASRRSSRRRTRPARSGGTFKIAAARSRKTTRRRKVSSLRRGFRRSPTRRAARRSSRWSGRTSRRWILPAPSPRAQSPRASPSRASPARAGLAASPKERRIPAARTGSGPRCSARSSRVAWRISKPRRRLSARGRVRLRLRRGLGDPDEGASVGSPTRAGAGTGSGHLAIARQNTKNARGGRGPSRARVLPEAQTRRLGRRNRRAPFARNRAPAAGAREGGG